MAEKVTKRQQAVLDCIEECIREKGYGPTVREVCQSLGLSSPSTVHVHLKALEEKGLIKRDATDNQVMIVARITLTVILLLGIFLAMDQNSSIFDIVSYAWAGFGASFGPLMLCSLYWRRTTLPGAVAGMLTGAVTVVAWKNLIAPLGGWFAVYELLPGFLLALLVIVVVSKLTPEPSKEVTDDFDTYMELDV